MLAVLLAILAFGGGCTLIYFLMDGPRKRALKLQSELNERESRLQEERERLNAESIRLSNTERTLIAAGTEHNRRVAAFQQEALSFARRKIAYIDLETENRILKADIKSEVTSRTHLDSSIQLLKKEVGKLKAARRANAS